MDDNERKIQIAIGILPTDPFVLAKLIKLTDSQSLIKWAMRHKSAKVRAAVIQNLNTAAADFLEIALFDHAETVRKAVHKYVLRRENVLRSYLEPLRSP